MMITKKIILTATVIICTLFSCKEETPKPSQMQRVMAIHDEVMPKMGKLSSLVGKLKPMADSLGINSPENKAMEGLQDANESMMQWMQNFGTTFNSEEIIQGKELSPEKRIMLDNEKEKVSEVKEKINTSIANAEALLNKK